MDELPPYEPARPARDRFVSVRGLRYHLHEWGDASLCRPDRPSLVLLHGWMDVGASFQFVVDAMHTLGDPPRHIVAPDWRGFGLTDGPACDAYWFPDYLGDLDALLDQLGSRSSVDLLGHSMGGNIAMGYAGVRPSRIRRLVNLEGFGLPATTPDDAPQRLARWLDELRCTARLKDYGSIDDVVARLRANNPRLRLDRAHWLAARWARQGDDGRWTLLADPAHKRSNPVLYRVDEVLATWRHISAPLLWVDGADTDAQRWWQGRYTRAEFDARLGQVRNVRRARLADAGHMLHHDQPEALARHLLDMLA